MSLFLFYSCTVGRRSPETISGELLPMCIEFQSSSSADIFEPQIQNIKLCLLYINKLRDITVSLKALRLLNKPRKKQSYD